MGIRAIEYRPWKGERTDPNRRWLVISKHVFGRNVRAKAVIVLLIFGMMLAHAFPIIGAIVTPHEEITDEDMVGREDFFKPGSKPEYDIHVTQGSLSFSGALRIDGTFTLDGELKIDGDVSLLGSVMGVGTLAGSDGSTSQRGAIIVDGVLKVTGLLVIGNLSGKPPGDGPGDGPGNITDLLEAMTVLTGNGTISGKGNITGNGTMVGEYTPGKPEISMEGYPGYLTNGLIIIFTMLLAAIICADIIADDLANASFVLYFSRPVRSIDYLLGKFVGLMWVMWIFCLVPPIAYVLVMMGTQTGDEFGGGLEILGKTALAGLVTAVFFLPYGVMISSFTKSKAYAGIGIFMSFFVLSIISSIFSETSDKWTLINPIELLHNMYQILFNGSIPEGIEGSWVGAVIAVFIAVPAVVTYLWVSRKGAGK